MVETLWDEAGTYWDAVVGLWNGWHALGCYDEAVGLAVVMWESVGSCDDALCPCDDFCNSAACPLATTQASLISYRLCLAP